MKFHAARPPKAVGKNRSLPRELRQRLSEIQREKAETFTEPTTDAQPQASSKIATRALLRSQDASCGSRQIDDSLREYTQEND